MKRSTLSICVLAAMTATSPWAEERVDLNPVVVKDNSLPLAQQNGQTIAIDLDNLATRQPQHLSEVLRGVAGVDIGGTTSVNQRIFIRGVDDTRLAITLDGARQGGHHFHHGGDLTIDPELLKQVDVAVGNNSVRNPSGSYGGAVRFETVDASDLLPAGQTLGAKVRVGYASNNEQPSASFSLFGKANEQFEWLASVRGAKHDFGEDGAGNAIGGDADNHSGLLKAKWQIAPAHFLEANLQAYQDDGKYPNRADFALTGPDSWNPATPQKIERNTYSLGYRWQPDDQAANVHAVLYRNDVDQSREYGASVSSAETTGLTVDVEQRLVHGQIQHGLAYGLDAYKMDSSLNVSKPLFGGRIQPRQGNESLSSQALYIEDAIRIGQITITPGLRYEHYDASDLKFSDKTYSELNKALGLHWQASQQWALFANYTDLFRGPPAQEILVSFGTPVLPNSDLEAETGENYEIGVTFTPQAVWHQDDRLIAQVKTFRSEFDNLIETRYLSDPHSANGPEVKQFINAGEATIKGVEASLTYQLNPVDVRFSYSHANSEDEKGNPLERDTGDRYSLSLRYQPVNQPWSFGWDSHFVQSNKINHRGKPYTQPGYGVSNAFVRYQVQSGSLAGLSAELGVYNLFDKQYASQTSRNLSEQYSDYEPGRDVRLNVAYQF